MDGARSTVPSIYDRKYYEVQKYLTVFLANPAYHLWLVNLKWWNELPKEQREVLQQAALTAQEWDRKELEGMEADYIKRLQKLITTHIQTESEAKDWAKAAQPMAEEWLKATGAEGKKLLDLVMEAQREYKAEKKK